MMACPCSKAEAGTLGPENSRTAEQGWRSQEAEMYLREV